MVVLSLTMGKIGAGGVIIDYKGDLMYAYVALLGKRTNNLAEVEASI